jgi:hypothetical protein
MNNYEVMFIIESAADDERKQATIAMVKEIVAAGGEVIKQEIGISHQQEKRWILCGDDLYREFRPTQRVRQKT